MVYREVSMVEIKEILLRIVSKSTVRNISKSLGVHRDTIKNYVALARKYGFDPYKDSKDMITDELIQKIKSCISISKNKWEVLNLPPVGFHFFSNHYLDHLSQDG